MPLTLQLTTETGEVVDELNCGWAFDAILSAGDLDGTVCLRFIDAYGATVFNRLQVPLLVQEIETAARLVSDVSITTQHRAWIAARELTQSAAHPDDLTASVADAQECARAIIALARRCEVELHSYLRFTGE